VLRGGWQRGLRLRFDDRCQHGMLMKVAGIFNTCGPPMHPNDGRVVSNFIAVRSSGGVRGSLLGVG
jgi:hypothetical protein